MGDPATDGERALLITSAASLFLACIPALWKQKLVYFALVSAAAYASTLYHIYAEKDNSYAWIDMFYANILVFVFYLQWLVLFTRHGIMDRRTLIPALLAFAATVFYLVNGTISCENDPEDCRPSGYEISHSMWHFLGSAAAFAMAWVEWDITEIVRIRYVDVIGRKKGQNSCMPDFEICVDISDEGKDGAVNAPTADVGRSQRRVVLRGQPLL